MIASVDGMIDELEQRAAFTSEEVINGILQRRQEALPRLIRLATDKKYWRDSTEYTWAPVCALHLLAAINTRESRQAIGESLLKYYDDTADWLLEDAPQMLAYMGTDATGMLAEIVQNTDADMFLRAAAAAALVMIADRHKESKQGIVALIRDTAQDESDVFARSLLVDSLLSLRDPDLYKYLKNCLETEFISDIMYDMKSLDDTYENGVRNPDEVTPCDPLAIFAYKNHPKFLHYRRVDEHTKLDIGRNDPCPCRSGKKFEACCLEDMHSL